MLKKASLGIVLALLLAVGAMAVYAADPMPTPVPTPLPIQPSFNDGRINAYDTGAPVAVFETRKSVPIVNDNGVPTTGDIVNAVQLLAWDGASAKEVLYVPIADIDAAIKKFSGIGSSKSTMSNTTASSNLSNSTANNTSSNSSSSTNSSVNNTTATTTTANNMANLNTTTTKANADSFVIAKKNGYTLGYSKSGYLWISTPADFEGKVYTFSWQKDF